ncbi:MAG: metallophosphoesterase, partial [Chitinispirillia bacterium]
MNILILLELIIALLFITSFQSCFQPELKRGDENWSFIVFGDIRRGFGIYSRIAKNISEIEPTPELSICMGDIMHVSGNEAEWENFWRYSKPLTEIMPYYFARGNHEGNDAVSERIFKEQIAFFRDRDSTFYYAIHHKKQHFIVLDTYIRGQVNSVVSNQR